MKKKQRLNVKYYIDMTEFLESFLPEFKQENKKTKSLMVKILSLPVVHKEDRSAYSISTEYLRSIGSTTRLFNRINDKYNLFTVDSSYRLGHYSRKMYPNPIVKDILNGFYRDTTQNNIKSIYVNSNNDIIEYFPLNSDIPNLLSIDGVSVHGNVKLSMDSLVDYIDNIAVDTQLRDLAIRWYKLANSKSLPFGYVPQSYKQIENKRVTGIGLSLQNTAKELRNVLLAGNYDYDFTNCHYSIINHYGNYPTINEYVTNTDSFRKTLARELCVSVKDIKTALIAMLYGANTSPYSTLSNIFEDDLELFWNHSLVVSLRSEIKQAMGELLGVTRTDRDSYKLLANTLMNIEHKILVCATDGLDIVIPMYDGFVYDSLLDTSVISDKIKQELGFSLEIKVKKL